MKTQRVVLTLALASLCACGEGRGDSDSLAEGIGEDSDSEGVGEGNPEVGCELETLGNPALRRLTRTELRNSLVAVFSELGPNWEDSALGPDPVSERGFSNDAELLTVGDQTAAELLETAERVAETITAPEQLASVLPCSQDAADIACAESFIRERGLLLFRRALTDAEVGDYSTLFQDVSSSSDFATGLRWTLVSLLSSPHFIYRFELGPEGSSGVRTLEPWEIATALAYTYSGKGPSAELLARAETGEFDSPEGRIAAARELWDPQRSEELLGRFFGEWLRYSTAAGQVKNAVPEYEDIRDELVEETRRFIDRVARVEGGGMPELLTAPDTELNTELAAYYGWGEATADYTTQTRPETYAVGLLAQGSVLAGNAHTDSSSPTLRGLLIHEKLLCNAPLTPPPDVPSIDPPEPGQTTTRERYELAHAGEDVCASCHQFFDPLGFAFEHFDESGRYRADENGLPIDASGSVPVLGTDTVLTFDGLAELSGVLADSVTVQTCAGDNLERFAFGGEAEGCRDVSLREALVAGEVGLAEYFVQLAGAEGFARRHD